MRKAWTRMTDEKKKKKKKRQIKKKSVDDNKGIGRPTDGPSVQCVHQCVHDVISLSKCAWR